MFNCKEVNLVWCVNSLLQIVTVEASQHTFELIDVQCSLKHLPYVSNVNEASASFVSKLIEDTEPVFLYTVKLNQNVVSPFPQGDLGDVTDL